MEPSASDTLASHSSDPSPPPLDETFGADLESHYYFHSNGTHLRHQLCANYCNFGPAPTSPVHNWRLSIQAIVLLDGDGRRNLIQEFPPHLLPFFSYKDVVVYVTGKGADLFSLFDAMYREWYPTRDRNVFNNGMLRDCGPFFSSTIRVNCEGPGPAPQPPLFMNHLIKWHVAFSNHLCNLLPQFCALQRPTRLLARPELTQAQMQTVPNIRVDPVQTRYQARYDYIPMVRRTFAECFVCVESGWENNGVMLVILNKDMLDRITTSKCEGLKRDINMEAQMQNAANLEMDCGEESNERMPEYMTAGIEAVMDHISVWRGRVEDIMRAIVVGDESRKRGLREFNEELGEWLGEGVYVGK